MYFEVKQIYMKLLGVNWLTPAQEFEFENWYNSCYKEEFGVRINGVDAE